MYDLLGNTAITIHLSQEGDVSLPLPGLGHDGEMVVLSIAQELANSMYYMTYFVNEYSAPEVIDGRTYVYDYSAPLTPDNRYVSKMWQQFYSAINRIHMLARADKSKLNLFDAQLSVMYALCYYNMVTIWGDVPYTTLYKHDASNREVFHPYFLPLNELPQSGCLPVDCGGLGCVLIKMSVFDKLTPPYFVFANESVIKGQMGYCIGEDMYFFRNCLRAGVQPYAEGSVRCGHIGKFIYQFKNIISNQTAD